MDKNLFIQIINQYHPFMSYYQMVKIYFKLIDSIYPNKKHRYLRNADVFNRLYSERKPPYFNCCTLHSSLKNFQRIMFIKLKTKYEKLIYQKATNFFIDLNIKILLELNRSNKYYIFKQKYSKLIKFNYNKFNNLDREFINLINKNLNKWELFQGFIAINRKGKIVDVAIPPKELIKLQKKYLFNSIL
jgi:hypothetical protein